MSVADPYDELLRSKLDFDTACGFDVDVELIHPNLLPHQRDIVAWAVTGGRRAIFAAFGLGKTPMQVECCRLIIERAGGKALIVCPLGVRQEFKRDAAIVGCATKFVRRTEEVSDDDGDVIYLTNYESIRDGRLDPSIFTVVSLDEAAVLRSYGSKTFHEFRRLCDPVPYRFVATATPSPNRHKELLHYAHFLGVMDTGQALTRFFKRDSSKAGNLQLMPHREEEFWAWLASWAVFVQRPSDLGYSDDGYDLPPLDVRWHEIEVDKLNNLTREHNGQGVLVRDGALGVIGASQEKRDTLADRVAKTVELVAADPDDHFILWHHTEAERHALETAFPDVSSVYGSLDLDKREERIIAFSEGHSRLLATKPVLSGSGCNFQRHCHRAIFVGVDFKFSDFIQAIHRIHRFQQPAQVRIDIIHADTERDVVRRLRHKWEQHREVTGRMSDLIREHGLSGQQMAEALARSIGTERVAASGEGWEIVNDDTVRETRRMETESVDLIVTSPPYGTQYEYVAAVEDFGHNDDNEAFWAQMDHLTPQMMRVLKPGRMCLFHVKDRIRFGNVTGKGVATVQPFAAEAIFHMIGHGFDFLGEVTLDTDVVRENNQTYRLTWSEVVKDRTKIGVGTPEKLLLFRKPQTDRSAGAADEPVVHSKDDYSLARWQIDAAPLWKSSGDRFITPDELEGMPVPMIRSVFSEACKQRVYDYEAHVRLGDDFYARGRLPTTFSLLGVDTDNPLVWTNLNRMQGLNSRQSNRGAELHVCLARGSLVLTRGDGYKPIEQINPGEMVLTHKGRWRPVEHVYCTGTHPVVKVRAQGVPGAVMTPNHRVWTRYVGHLSAQTPAAAKRQEPTWVEAERLEGSYVNRKVPSAEPSSIDTRTWWVVGRWLADGHYHEARDGLHLSCGRHKLDALLAKLGPYGPGGPSRQTGPNCFQLLLRDKDRTLRNIVKRCGSGAAGKRLPPEAFTLEQEHARALLDGYLSGDCHWLPDKHRWMGTTVSRELALGVAFLVQRAYGVSAAVFAGRPERDSTIEGRSVHCQQEWNFMFTLDHDGPRHRPLILDDGAWLKVRHVDDAGAAETWNLTVAEDHSYTAEGFVVKNCPFPFDVVDRCINQWSNPGDLVFDPFGGLGTTVVRALAAGRRGKCNELNPVYWSDAVYYALAEEEKVNMPSLFDLLDGQAAS